MAKYIFRKKLVFAVIYALLAMVALGRVAEGQNQQRKGGGNPLKKRKHANIHFGKLSRLLASRNLEQRKKALQVLLRKAPTSPKTVVLLLRTLKRDPEKWMRRRAASGLVYSAGNLPNRPICQGAPNIEKAVPFLTRSLLRDPAWGVRTAAAYAMGWIGALERETKAKMIPALLKALRDRKASVRLCAVEAIGRIGDFPHKKEAISHLLKRLRDKSVRVRSEAAFALTCIAPRNERVTEGLISVLNNDPSLRVRSGIPSSLGASVKSPEDRVLKVLLEALKSDEPRIAGSAALGLAHAARYCPEASEKIVSALIKTLDHKLWSMRRCAAASLGRIGPKAKSAVRALRKALNDKREEVRKAASDALNKIQKEKTKPGENEKRPQKVGPAKMHQNPGKPGS